MYEVMHLRSSIKFLINAVIFFQLVTFEHKSDATRKMIVALTVLLVALQEGRLVIIDELDTKLHPKLRRYVISMFTNSNINKHGAQLLFTSHDMSTMKNTVFRRDEICFVALDENHSSEIYSLYEIRREDNERVNSTAVFDNMIKTAWHKNWPCYFYMFSEFRY